MATIVDDSGEETRRIFQTLGEKARKAWEDAILKAVKTPGTPAKNAPMIARVTCPDCRGTGSIALLTSVVPCNCVHAAEVAYTATIRSDGVYADGRGNLFRVIDGVAYYAD